MESFELQTLKAENERLKSAIRRAQTCIEERRPGDAIKILKTARPRIVLRDDPPPTGKHSA